MRARRQIRESATTTTLPVLLDRLGTELDSLAHGVNVLQVKLSPILVELMSDSHHMFADLQRLDVLAQSLASLSAFVQSLGEVSGGRRVDPAPLAETLPLRDLAERLCGRAVADEADDFELF